MSAPNIQNLQALCASLAHLEGPRIIIGDCLMPDYPSGTLVWADRTREANVGDLAAFEYSEEARRHLGEKWNLHECAGGVKWLREYDGVRWLESGDGRTVLTSQWILIGPVVATFQWLHAPEEFAAMITLLGQHLGAAQARMKTAGRLGHWSKGQGDAVTS